MNLIVVAGERMTDLELFDSLRMVREPGLTILLASSIAHPTREAVAFFPPIYGDEPKRDVGDCEMAWKAVNEALADQRPVIDLSEWAFEPSEEQLAAAGLEPDDADPPPEPDAGDEGTADPHRPQLGQRVILRLGVGDASEDELGRAIGLRVADVQRGGNRVAVICEG
jgi:hypothetical protein